MATVPAFNSVAARMIRTAISARLAAMMVEKGGVRQVSPSLLLLSAVLVVVVSSGAVAATCERRVDVVDRVVAIVVRVGVIKAVVDAHNMDNTRTARILLLGDIILVMK
eukprot:scaffold4703_cov166-Amphora_coffeaeformis.AAC.4